MQAVAERRSALRVLGLAAVAVLIAVTISGTAHSARPAAASPAATAGNLTPWGTVSSPPPSHHPLGHPAGQVSAASLPESDLSNNWAGLTDTAGPFTGVSATWTVPTVQPSSQTLESSTWVGVDGVSNNNLIQAGTEQDSGPGGPTYFAWFEILPTSVQELGPVNPGDQMSVTIQKVSVGTWSIDISDSTGGQRATGNLPYGGPGTSAEWIEEAPSNLQGVIAPLANFGTVQFNGLSAGGAAVNPSALSPVSMVNNADQVIAYPNSFTSSSFAVTYGAPGSSTPSTVPTSTTLPAGATTTSTTGIPGHATLSRLSGTSRDSTAIAVSNQLFPTGGPRATAAVLADDEDFPDALAGTPLAVAKGGPLLLTPPTGLDPAVATELTRLLPAGATVYVLGGTAALGDTVTAAVTALGFNVVRYGGATRFDTAVIIASEGLGNPTTILEATGLDFPDALAAGAAAAAAKGAVLLTNGSAQALATTNYLAAFPADTRYALGGPAATADPTAKPLVGGDRYQTSTLVAQTFFPAPTIIGIATGLDFPDALSGGAQIGHLGGPLVLTDPDALSASTQSYLTAHAAALTGVFVYGGQVAVSTVVLSSIATALGVAAPSS